MLTGSTLVRVVPNPGGGWDVREPGSTRALSHFAAKDKAVRRARTAMLDGGVVHVLDGEGVLLRAYAVPGPRERPWWYIPPRPLSWGTGVLFLLLGILEITGHHISEFRFWLSLATGLLGGFYLGMLVMSHRRDRQSLQSE